MIALAKKIKCLLNPEEQRRAIGVLFLTIFMALFEIIGIASILPFMAVLSSPDMVETNKYLHWGYDFFGFTSANRYLFFLGIIVLCMLLISNGIKALTRWKTLTFSVMTGHTISSRLLHQYLHQPYAFFLMRNSAHLSKSILGEVNSLVSHIIVPFADVIARFVVIIAILSLLMIADPVLAISTGIVLGGAFGMVYVCMRKWLLAVGKERLEAQGKRFQIVNEAFLGIKNVKLTGHENTYTSLYDAPSKIFSRTTALSGVAGEIPRYAMEVIAFGGILFIILYLLLQKQGLSQALPLMTLYAFAGYRLMPSFQTIFQSYTKIRFHSAVIDQIEKEMAKTALSSDMSARLHDETNPMPFESSVEFRNVSFQYDMGHRPVLNDLSFSLAKNSSLGIVGKTGSGKTTAVDLLLGLLTPTGGEILIDGVPLTDETRRAWQKNCAYVTQHIYLCDDTVRTNIAFGLPEEEIDEAMVRRAAKMAALDGFIENDLPQGYDTMIGENGIRLSGGQRQRIGLARALYLDRPVLVLDEATSALDNDTENQVMDAISSLGTQKTIIMIAHRLRSLDQVKQILKM